MPACRRTALASLAVAAAALLAAPALAAARARAAHPAVGPEPQDCAACHRDTSPESFAAWERSAHGVALVKCVVCHGSTGKDFRARPAATSCQGCHAAKVASLARRGTGDCFACHAPHALTANPHR
jgi:hypothetical protein